MSTAAELRQILREDASGKDIYEHLTEVLMKILIERPKNAYDSCNKYAGAAMNDSSIIAAIARSKGLAEISVPANIIREQDSLLDLANSSKKEQLKAVKDLIKLLERKRQDSILKAADDLLAGEGKDAKGKPTSFVGAVTFKSE